MNCIRDLIHKIPEQKQELCDYILNKYSHIKEHIDKNPQSKEELDKIIAQSFDKYQKHIGGLTHNLGKVGSAIGYGADLWFLETGDIIGALNGKFLHLLGQIPEKTYSLVYGFQTKNYTDSLQNILEGLVSYLPGFTFIDQGLTRIIQKRMIKDSVVQFEKDVLIYKPWIEKLKHRFKQTNKQTNKQTIQRLKSQNPINKNFQGGLKQC